MAGAGGGSSLQNSSAAASAAESGISGGSVFIGGNSGIGSSTSNVPTSTILIIGVVGVALIALMRRK
jgi:hypothetical protein